MCEVRSWIPAQWEKEKKTHKFGKWVIFFQGTPTELDISGGYHESQMIVFRLTQDWAHNSQAAKKQILKKWGKKSDGSVFCIFGFIWPYRMRKWTVAPCHCWAKIFLAPLRQGAIRHRIEIQKSSYFSNQWSHKDDIPLIFIRNGQFKGVYAQDNCIWATERLRNFKKGKF